MNALTTRSAKSYMSHKARKAAIGVVVTALIIGAFVVLYFTVLKKPYRGGSKSKGSTRLVFEAQTQQAPNTGSADSGSTTPSAPDLKSLAKTIQSDMKKQLNTKTIAVYAAGYADALWVANNDASYTSDKVALYKNKIPKACVSSYKDSTSTSFVVDGSKKTVTASTDTPAWGLFVVETDAAATAVSAAATKLMTTGTVKYGTATPAASTADDATKAVCTFTKSS